VLKFFSCVIVIGLDVENKENHKNNKEKLNIFKGNITLYTDRYQIKNAAYD